MNEEEIYYKTKMFLNKENYIIVAGQPPRGGDHLPVIEIKSGKHNKKGSLGSYKPDLVAIKENRIFIIECKPKFDNNDYNKLCEILDSEDRLDQFYNELMQRKIFHKNNYYKDINYFKKNVFGCLAYGGDYIQTKRVYHIVTKSFKSDSVMFNLKL